jgi:tape measure domain-containing protein
MANIGSAVYKVLLDKSAVTRGLQQVDTEAKNAGQKAGKSFSDGVNQGVNPPNFRSPVEAGLRGAEAAMRSSGGRMGSMMQGIFQGIGQGIAGTLVNTISGAVSASIGAIKSISSTIYEVGTNAEQLKISFRTIIGDAQKADKLLQDMQKFSAATPFTSREVQGAGQQLLTVVKPEDMIKTLTRLGDVAAGSKRTLGEITTIYQQVLSKGKVQAEETIQFAERGIDVQGAMAKVLGVTKEELIELQSKGKVTSDVLVSAFKLLADEGGKYNGIMQKQSQTLAGLASTAKDNFEVSAGLIYTKVNPALVQMLKSFTEAGDKAAKNNGLLELTGQISEKIAKWFKEHQALIDKVFIAIVKMTESGLREALNVCKGIYGWLQKNPEVMNAIVKQVQLWGSGIQIVWNGLKSLAPIFGEIVKFCAKILDFFNAMGEKIQELVKGAGQLGEVLGGAAASLGLTANGQQGSAESIMGNSQAAVNGGRYTIDGQNRLSLENSRKHHDYQRSKDGSGRLVKDLTLAKDGNTAVPVPSPVAGKVIESAFTSGGYGGKIVVQAAGTTGKENQVLLGHLQKLNVRVGEFVARGQHLGVQGGGPTDKGKGNTTGRHLHMEAPEAIAREYYKSLQSSDWGQNNANATNSRNAKGLLSRKSTNDQREENFRGFAQAIALGETNGGRNTKQTGPNKGIFQNSEADVNYFKKAFPQLGPFSTTGSFESQLNTVRAGLKHRGALEDVYQGNYGTATRKANRFWTSLPGGAEQSPKWQGTNINEFLPGRKRFVPGWDPTRRNGQGGPTPAELKKQEADAPKSMADMERDASTQGLALKTELANSKKAEAEKKRKKAEAEAKKKKREADKIKKDAQERDRVVVEAQNAVTDSDLERLDALAQSSGSAKLKQTVDIRRVEVQLKRDLASTDLKKKEGGLNASQASAITANLKAAAQSRIAAIKNDTKKAVQAEEKQRTDIMTQAQREVAQSEISRLDALADATGDRNMKAAVERQKVQQELANKLQELKGKVASKEVSPQQAGQIEKNYRAEAASRITQINNQLAKDTKEESDRVAEENKRLAEETAQKAKERAENNIKAQETIAAQDADILRLQASLNNDLSLALAAELQTINNEYQRAINEVDASVSRGDTEIQQGNAQKANILQTTRLRQAKAQQDFENKNLEIAAEARRVQAAKGKTIQDAITKNTQGRYDREDATVNAAGTIANSDLELAKAQAERERNPDKQRELNIANGQQQVRIDLMNQLQQVEQLGRSGLYSAEQLNKMRENAEAMANIKLEGVNQQFLTLGQTIQRDLVTSFGQFLHSVVTGSQTIQEALAGMLSSIASNLATAGINRLLGGLLGGLGGGVSAFAQGTASGGKKFNSIGEAMQWEKQTSGRKPILAVLHEGEMVIPARQVESMKSVNAFANGTSPAISGKYRQSTSVNLGDINIQGVGEKAVSPADAQRLKDMIKSDVYGILLNETRQGGMFSKR